MIDDKLKQTEYMGDGVYATFDGFGLELRVNDHRNPVSVYIEPEVLESLNKFFQSKTIIGKTDE